MHGPPVTPQGPAGLRQLTEVPAPYTAPPELLKDISGASHRLRALAALSGSLTDSLSPEDAAALVEKKALSALGATSAVVITLGPFPPNGRTTGTPVAPSGETKLTVVHDRLEHMGLGSMCAVIHDPQRDQRELYRAVREQLDALPEAKSDPKAEAKLARAVGSTLGLAPFR